MAADTLVSADMEDVDNEAQANDVEATEASREPDDSSGEEAATRIQNKHRQNQARARVGERRQQGKAATHIQNKQRQKAAKGRVQSLHAAQRQEEEAVREAVARKKREEEDHAAAALAIQNVQRQKMAQAIVAEKRCWTYLFFSLLSSKNTHVLCS
jgi:hypothetical protein